MWYSFLPYVHKVQAIPVSLNSKIIIFFVRYEPN